MFAPCLGRERAHGCACHALWNPRAPSLPSAAPVFWVTGPLSRPYCLPTGRAAVAPSTSPQAPVLFPQVALGRSQSQAPRPSSYDLEVSGSSARTPRSYSGIGPRGQGSWCALSLLIPAANASAGCERAVRVPPGPLAEGIGGLEPYGAGD